jgi:hypothetical protein
MAVAPHYAARQQFLTILNEFLADGCENWQREELGWCPPEELGPGVPAAPLLVARFVKEICEDASYKFWMGIRKGAENDADVALHTRRVFDQFLVRVRRCKFFERAAIAELERYFDLHFWPIEKVWLEGRQAREARGKLFAELGGPAAVAAISKDVQVFYEWSRGVIAGAYNNNDYQRALQVSDAVIEEAAAAISRDFSDRDVVLGLCALQEAACFATIVRLNCWVPEPGRLLAVLDDVLRKRISPANISPHQRDDLGRFVTIATMLKAACRRFDAPETTEPSLLGIYHVLGYLRFHQAIRARVADETSLPVDSATVTLMLSEAVSRRADWLRSFGRYRQMTDVLGFAGKAAAQLSSVLGAEEEPGLVNTTLSFMSAPITLIEQEWDAVASGTASANDWNDAALAVLGARVWLQQDGIGLTESHAWLNRAQQKLDTCGVHLAWSDFYCTCDAYMQERGNPILSDYALNSVRKLQRKAGNDSAEEHFESEVLKVASRRKRKLAAGDVPDDIDLQWFLREEPQSLSKGRR